MNGSSDMTATAEDFGRRLADQTAAYVNAKVEQALALERDRHDAEIAELRSRLDDLEAVHETRGDDADVMTRAMVRAAIERHGWSTKA